MNKILLPFIALFVFLFFTESFGQEKVSTRRIPDTEDNQRYFRTTQYLIQEGDFDEDSCGKERDQIIDCIKKCNKPGFRTRMECCCVARSRDDKSREFAVGLKGGCRYSQRVLNFTTSVHYSSTPIKESPLFFDERSCGQSAENKTTDSCTCAMEWRLSTRKLKQANQTKSTNQTAVPSTTPEEITEPTPSKEPEPTTPSVSAGPKEPVVVAPPKEEPNATTSIEETPVSSASSEEDNPFSDISAEDAPTQTPDDDGSVCVEESYLLERGVKRIEMVHQNAPLTNVLCPIGTSLPCGTTNHKIRFGSKHLSYKELCEHPDFTCEKDVRHVNSVYSHLWKDVDHDGVVMTMFDVRYPEAAQKVLHKTMHQWRMIRSNIPIEMMFAPGKHSV